MIELSELTNGLSSLVLSQAVEPNALQLLKLGQTIHSLILETRANLLEVEQKIEEREATIAVAIAADKELSNDFKRKAAKAALSKDDVILEEATLKKELLQQRLAALDFIASQYRVLAQLLPSSVNN